MADNSSTSNKHIVKCTSLEIEIFIKKVLLALTFNKLDHRNVYYDGKANFKVYYSSFMTKYNGSFDLMISSYATDFTRQLIDHNSDFDDEDEEEIKEILWSKFVEITNFVELDSLHQSNIDNFTEELYNIVFE